MIVVYQSSTGFTKQYAEWIAEDLGCEAVDVAKATPQTVSGHELVIYGGWIMGGAVMGLDKIRKCQCQSMVVFAVGSTPESLLDLQAMKEQNQLGELPFFYMQGGFRFEKLNFAVRGMLKMLRKSVEKKENKSPQDQFMADTLGKSFDSTDRKYITPLEEAVKAQSI